ncbi:nuclear transport factor 2 family protein [Dyella telluris]|uniref:Nuclear transport factor 2 family protein n=1 Tax=Dyella telluris TaxID=2763498 RepID=A0A7G8PZ18_9GAMM|nr:nuclear transport factor 2 family protein [Dyella telluris]QNJ99775.1 nuclear transport factor 2 family protein [Dyella telluris]
MRLTRLSWIVFAMSIAMQAHAGHEVGDYRGLPDDLAAAATAYDLAQFHSDRGELERLLADDYTLAGSNGKNQTKAEFIDDSTAPGSKTTYVAITQQVRKVWPDGAVLGGMFDARGMDRGKAYTLKGRFVDVWAKRDGRWQVIFTQAHRVP